MQENQKHEFLQLFLRRLREQRHLLPVHPVSSGVKAASRLLFSAGCGKNL